MAVDLYPYWMKPPSKKVMERLKKIAGMVTSTVTVRRIAYMLFPGVHGKKLENAYNNTIKDVVRLRIRGMIGWDMIRESRCEFIEPMGYDDVDDYILNLEQDGEELASGYRRDRRDAHIRDFMVWFEKDTVEPEFKKICRRYHVPIVCGRGQATWSIKKQMSEFLGKGWLVLYCGDNDEKGHEIKDVIERDLAYHNCPCEIKWAMVTDEMEEKYDLPSEARLDDFDLGDLEKILEGIILEYIDKDKLKEIENQETEDKKRLQHCRLVFVDDEE